MKLALMFSGRDSFRDLHELAVDIFQKERQFFLIKWPKKRPIKKKIVQMNDGINIAYKSYLKLHSHGIFLNCIFCYQIKPYSRAVFRQKENNILGTFVLFYRCFISCRKPSWKAPTRCICFFLLSDPHFHI